MFNVGVAYWEGAGVERDRDIALQWWERSATAGDVGAQFNLGLAYYIGEERPVDLKEAEKWIRMAANQNHPEAKRILKILSKGEQEIPQKKTASTEQAGGANENVQQNEQSTTAASSGSDDANTENTYWKTKDITPLQSAPDGTGIEFTTLPAGIPVEIVGSGDNWSKITLPGGLKTWIFEDFLELSGGAGVIKGDGVRVRPLPSTNNSISPPIGAYRDGDRVTLIEKKGQWYQIRAPQYIGGWTTTKNIESYQDTKQNREELWKRMVANGL
jgi:SH3-like domain-containing protein